MAVIQFSNPCLGVPALCIEVVLANSFGKRLKGLLGEKAPRPLLLYPCTQIHTIGIKFPIDVIYFNADFKILAVSENVLPGRIEPRVSGSRYVLELPSGFVAAHHLSLNSSAVFRPGDTTEWFFCGKYASV